MQPNGPDSELSGLSSGTPTASACSSGIGQVFPSPVTSSSASSLRERPTSFPEDSPVRTFHTPDYVPELPASVQDSTGNWCVPFAWYDPVTQLWRTWQLCLTGEWAPYSETWPKSGMTRSGIAYQRVPLVPFIIGSESLSPLIPTPTACDHKGSGRPRKGRGPGNNLRDWFRQSYGFLYPPVPLVEWLQGFPIGFTDSAPLETPFCPYQALPIFQAIAAVEKSLQRNSD